MDGTERSGSQAGEGRRTRRQFLATWPPALTASALWLVGCGGSSEPANAVKATAKAAETQTSTVASPSVAPSTPSATATPAPPTARNGKIAFHRIAGAGVLNILTMEPDGSNEVQIMSRGAWPKWSPDGKRILFLSARDAGSNRLYVMSADGSELRRVTPGDEVVFDARWHPDGKRMVFAAGSNDARSIYLIGDDGTGLQKLIDANGAGGGLLGGATFSPDGSRVAFARSVTGVVAIFVANADGTNPVRISGAQDNDSQPAWSPDGRRIAFNNRTTVPGTNIFTMNGDGSDRKKVTKDRELFQTAPVWAPDGSRIAFNRFPSLNAPPYVDIVSISPSGTDE